MGPHLIAIQLGKLQQHPRGEVWQYEGWDFLENETTGKQTHLPVVSYDGQQ